MSKHPPTSEALCEVAIFFSCLRREYGTEAAVLCADMCSFASSDALFLAFEAPIFFSRLQRDTVDSFARPRPCFAPTRVGSITHFGDPGRLCIQRGACDVTQVMNPCRGCWSCVQCVVLLLQCAGDDAARRAHACMQCVHFRYGSAMSRLMCTLSPAAAACVLRGSALPYSAACAAPY